MKPEWCPHPECEALRTTQDAACSGRLPQPEPHGQATNTHRICLHGSPDDGEWTFDLQVHTGDLYALDVVFDAVRADAGIKPVLGGTLPDVDRALRAANNALYFNDNSDYQTALYQVGEALGMKPDEIGTEFMDAEEPGNTP